MNRALDPLAAQLLLDLPDMAKRRGMRIHIHLGESHSEAEWSETLTTGHVSSTSTSPRSLFPARGADNHLMLSLRALREFIDAL